jgi:hypothetical protein
MKVAKKATMAAIKGMTCAGMMMFSFRGRMDPGGKLRLDQDQTSLLHGRLRSEYS